MQIALFHPDGLHPLYRDDFDGWLRAREAFGAISRQADERGVPVLFVLVPYLEDMRDDAHGYLDVHRKIAAAIGEIDRPIPDLRPDFVELDADGRHWWALPWDSHPGVEAHRVIGERVAAVVSEMLPTE